MTYAVVDIETTGGYAAANGIIEISIRVFDGNEVIETFDSLVNPRQSIPKYIQAFTGITDEMVADAPCFDEIAEQVFTILQGNVFVAHNVNFDYSFIKSHLDHCGYTLNLKKLCTIRLARQVLPGHASYSLGKLCTSLGIELVNRHRAGGDADATVLLFRMIIENDEKGLLGKSLARNSKEQLLPPNVPKSHFNALPSTPGVYYFHDQKGKVVYVGKAKDIRKRVNSHFSNNSDSRQKQNFVRSIFSISFQSTATELMAAILESAEIKRLWPSFNTSQKKQEEVFGIFVYEDQNGYMRLAIEKKRKYTNPLCTFHYKVDGHGVLRRLMKDFALCPKLCFIQTDNDPCIGFADEHCHGACEKREVPGHYNKRVLDAIASLTHRPSYVVIDKGLSENEISCIMVVKGSFFGMGYLPKNVEGLSQKTISEFIKPYKENSFIRSILQSHANHFPSQVRMLEED